MKLSNANVSNILDRGKDGVLIVDQHKKITYVNDSARKIINTQDTLIGKDLHEVFRVCNYFTGESYNYVIDEVFSSLKSTGLRAESALIDYAGNKIFISTSISPIVEETLTGVVIFFKDITQIKHTEQELSKFRKAFEKSIESMLITNDQWMIEYCNEKSKKRIKACDLRPNQDFWQVNGYKLSWHEKENIFKSLDEHNFWVGEVLGSGFDEKWYRVSIVALRDVMNKVINYVISEVDITFENESKRLLINERKNLSAIIEGAPVGMMTVTKEYGVLQINEECRQVLDVPLNRPQNILTMMKTYSNLFVVEQLIKKVLKTGVAIRNYECVVYKDSQTRQKKRWIKASAVPIVISEKQCVLLSFEDETLKKEMAKTIVRNERQLRLVTDHMHDIILQVNVKGAVDYYSTSIITMLSSTEERVAEKSVYDFINPEDHEILNRMFKKCRDSRVNQKFEVRFVDDDQADIWVEILMKYIENEDFDIAFLLYGRDVTQRRIAEEEIVKSRELAIAANNAKSEFLANMSHEIRTPLNGIIGMANIALMNATDNKQKDNVGMIKHSAENLLKIINSVLDFSKIEAGKLTIENNTFHIHSELKRFVKPFKVQAMQKDIEFHATIDETISESLNGDMIRINQVLTNLIGNAIKFTEFGSVNLDVTCKRTTETHQWLEFTVKDTGVGIKEKDKHKIFKSFSQADGSVTRKFGGTGLGLNITKKLVELMNGHVSFESEYGKGSTFVCEVPFAKSGRTRIAREKDHIIEEDSKGLGFNILVVEDDRVNQKLAQRLLKRKGYGITMVENGKEAVDIYEDDRFDLILMDIQMPVMNGLKATEKIRDKAKVNIPIIALTAYAIKGDREKFLKQGMDDYISKPIDIDEFYKILEKHLVKKNKDDYAIQKILNKIKVSSDEKKTPEVSLIQENVDNLNMQLKYIASSLRKEDYEQLEERCYAFKNYVTSLKMMSLRKMVFDLELNIRKEKEDLIISSYEKIIGFINNHLDKPLKGVEINENTNSRR